MYCLITAGLHGCHHFCFTSPPRHRASEAKELRVPLRHFALSHPSQAVRQLASVAYVTFLRVEATSSAGGVEASANRSCVETTNTATVVSCCDAPVCELSRLGGPMLLLLLPTAGCASTAATVKLRGGNAAHGQCCILKAWLSQSLPDEILKQRKR